MIFYNNQTLFKQSSITVPIVSLNLEILNTVFLKKKYFDTQKSCNHFQIWSKWLYHWEMPSCKHVREMNTPLHPTFT